MRIFILCIVIVVASTGAEPPTYRARFYQQQQQQQQAPYAPAAAPSGPLLLVPGEYVVQVNAPYQQADIPDVVVNAPIQEYGSPYVSGQYQLQPGVVQQTYPEQQYRGNVKFTTANQDQQLPAAQYQNQDQVYNGRYQQEQKSGQNKDQVNNGRYQQEQKSGTTQDQVNNGRYQQEQKSEQNKDQVYNGRYQQEQKFGRYQNQGVEESVGSNSRYTPPKEQVEYYTEDKKELKSEQEEERVNFEDDAEEDEETEKEPVEQGRFQQPQFGKYTQQQRFGRLQQSKTEPEVKDQYSKVNKNTPSKTLYTEESDEDSTEVTVVDKKGQKSFDKKSGQFKNDEEENKEMQGFYYLLLPDGKLQKVVYMTEEDLKKMAFVARLQYQNIEPIQGPVYTYNPANSPFVKVF